MALMAVARLDSVQRITISKSVLETTIEALRLFGAKNLEGLVLWLGQVHSGTAAVTRLVVPEQHPIESEDGVGYFVDSNTLFNLNRALTENQLRLIGQVHSHPSEAYHSETDDRYAIVTENGGVSLVVPDFGDSPADPKSWAIYRLREGEWCELSDDQVEALFQIDEDQ